MNFIKKLVKMAKGKPKEEEIDRRPHKHSCTTCNKPIYEGERWSKVQGMYFHKVCLKGLKQQF